MKRERERTAEREDLRQRRTKKFLVHALLALMEERPFQELSVVDICERAMVHRTTFYAHFEDKYALLRYAIGELQQEFEMTEEQEGRCTGERDYFLAVFRNALTFLRDHRKLYLSGITGGGAALQLLEDAVVEKMCGRVRTMGSRGASVQDELSARFCAGGILSMVRWWAVQDDPVDESCLAECLERFLPEEGEFHAREEIGKCDDEAVAFHRRQAESVFHGVPGSVGVLRRLYRQGRGKRRHYLLSSGRDRDPPGP